MPDNNAFDWFTAESLIKKKHQIQFKAYVYYYLVLELYPVIVRTRKLSCRLQQLILTVEDSDKNTF